jgi:hypothetical protein
LGKKYSQAPEQSDWLECKPLFNGGKIKIYGTLGAVTPLAGWSNWQTGHPTIEKRQSTGS